MSQIRDNPPLMRDQRAQNRVDQTSACLRVDNIPAFPRPFYITIAWLIGAILFAYYAVCRVTSRISIEGPGNHDLSRHSIFCIWHESWWTYPVVFLRYRTAHAMISHPAAYMKPLHCVYRLMGLKGLFLGSSGNEGRLAGDAANSPIPRVINVDKNPAYPAAIRALKRDGILPRRVRLRQCKYLNNIVEQDHRSVKKRTRLAKGYGSFQSAWRTLEGIETVNMIRKGRVRWVSKDDVSAQARFVAKLFGIAAWISLLQFHLALDPCSLKLRNRTQFRSVALRPTQQTA